MKPDLMDGHDKIELMLENSWETMPTQLEEQLLALPDQLQTVHTSSYAKLTLALNSILVVWALGLIYFFKDLIDQGAANLSTLILELGVLLPSIMNHPVFFAIGFGILGFTWWRFDLDFN